MAEAESEAARKSVGRDAELAEAMGLTLKEYFQLPEEFRANPAKIIAENSRIQEVLARRHLKDIADLANELRGIQGFDNILEWVYHINRDEWIRLVNYFASVKDQFHAQLLELLGELAGFTSPSKKPKPPIGPLHKRRVSRFRSPF